MKSYLIVIGIVIGISSCYNYDGPTRPKQILKPRIIYKPKEKIDVKPNITSKEYLEGIVEDIKRTLPSAQVSLIEDSIKVLFPDNILYGNSSVLPLNDIYNELSKLAKLIIKYDQTNVLVTGHTDKNGNEVDNRRLSKLRADYIRDLLLAYRAPQSRINSWGLGSSSPISSEKIKEGKKRNRRVEFIILSTIQDDEKL